MNFSVRHQANIGAFRRGRAKVLDQGRNYRPAEAFALMRGSIAISPPEQGNAITNDAYMPTAAP